MTAADVPIEIGHRGQNTLTNAVPPRGVSLEAYSYDDDVVRKFMLATFVWGLVGMLVGLLIAVQLAVAENA